MSALLAYEIFFFMMEISARKWIIKIVLNDWEILLVSLIYAKFPRHSSKEAKEVLKIT